MQREDLGYESGSKMGTFDEKNGVGKSRATVPLNLSFFLNEPLKF